MQEENKLLRVLSEHHGSARAISMRSLYEAVYGKWPSDKINGTRRLRYLITALRKDGIPICHTADPTGGGYYLASGGTDLENQCKRLRAQALRKLAMEARMRKIALPELIGQIGLALVREGQRQE